MVTTLGEGGRRTHYVFVYMNVYKEFKKYIYIYTHECMYIYIYIYTYMYGHPPIRHAKMHILPIYP